MNDTQTQTTHKTVKVRLLDDNHTHAGQPCKKGDVIQLRPSQAKRLIEAKRAEPA